MSEDEEISIDLGKIKGLFKRKKKKEKTDSKEKVHFEEKGEFKKDEGKPGIGIDDTSSEYLPKEKHQEIAGEEVKKEDKIFFVEKEKQEEDADEISLDFSKIKGSITGLFKKKEKGEKRDIFNEKNSDEISLDFKGFDNFFRKHKKWLIPLALILIAMSFSIYFRTMPQRLPITDDWAENTVNNYYRNQFAAQVEQQYPNLPAQNKNALVNDKYVEFLRDNEDMVEQQIKATSQQFKENFKDEDGQTYLLAIDPWLWYGMARNYVENGHWGNEIIDGESRYTLRNGREGQGASYSFLAFSIVITYGIFNLFGNNSVLAAAFFVPVIMMSLGVLGMFFIGRKISGNLAGLVTAIVFGIHPALLSRTSGGFTDTDLLIGFFQAFAILFFILAFEENKNWKKISYFALFGLFMAFYEHDSWWFVIDLLLASILVYGVVYILVSLFKKKDIEIKNKLIIPVSGLLLFYSSFKFLILFLIRGTVSFKEQILGPFIIPFPFLSSKQVAVSTIWPNVLTTVAELNKSSIKAAISQIGGNFLFFLGFLGVIILIVKGIMGLFNQENKSKNDLFYGLLLLIWLVTTIFAAQSSMRFSSMVVPAFALSLGVLAAFLYEEVSIWTTKHLHIHKLVTKGVILLLIVLIIFVPLFKSASAVGKNEIPSMNDAWYDVLTKIKDNSQDAIITSWWDFGHWFVAVAERRVTFDGGDQGERIHWVGKTLLTSNEKMSVGLLRMLNCGQQKPVHVLEESFDGDMVKAVDVLNRMIVLNDKEKAIKLLKKEGLSTKQIAVIISITYCGDLIDQFYIASEDMVGKSGVWGHFGSWDFEKASMYSLVYGEAREKSVLILMDEFGLNEDEAESKYSEIQGISNADTWVSPWPNYMSGLQPCKKNNDLLECQVNAGGGTIIFEINLKNMNTEIKNIQESTKPKSIVYPTKESVEEKFFEDSTADFSVILVPNGENYQLMLTHPSQAKSMFTQLFFFEGHGLECFDLFDKRQQVTGGLIYTYKVDFNCVGKNRNYFLPEEQVRAKHILIQTEGRTDEEALAIVNGVKGELNFDSFEKVAEEYSEDPGSAVKGGDLGWFGKGVMVPEFEKTAFALEKGEVSEPIKTQFGYHIIKLIDRREVEKESPSPKVEVTGITEKEEILDDYTETEENQSKTFKVSV